MELIDVLTPAGEFTGERKPKSEVHRHGDWHRSVHVWIVTSGGKILLQRRALQKENNPGLWDVSAAGHVSAGESVIDCAIREVQEELGLRIEGPELRHIATLAESSVLNDGKYIDNEIHEIFLVIHDVDLSSLQLQADEVAEVVLIRPSDLASYRRVPHEREEQILLDLLAGQGIS